MVQSRIASIPTIHLNEDLPVSQQSDRLIQAIQDHQVIIVAGETGSGKTTQLPKIAMLAGRGVTGQIGHTQPRRLAARSVANRIAEELGEPLGQTVSFKVRFTEQGTPNSIVKLMTDGILLAELAHDRFLSRYDTIIIDEAHERSLNIDFIMGYLKNLLPKRPDLKVIITSATLDTERFSQYFSSFNKKTKETKPAPVFNVEGRSYPVEVWYRPLTDAIVTSSDDDNFDNVEENLPRAITSAVAECYADATQKGVADQADILIFAATEAEIHDLTDILTQYAPQMGIKHTQILPLFARQSFAEQQQIFHPTGGRRIIIATNVAETALTVPNIRYVIDLGFARISRYDYRSRVQRLPIEAISQAAANQRKGRSGRVSAGVCIRLYSEEDFNSRPLFTEPEILRTNLASVILQMANLGLGEVENFDFIQPPDNRLINDGRKLLEELGAIPSQKALTQGKNVPSTSGRGQNGQGGGKQNKNRHHPNQLTKIGQAMAKMPIDPRLARMLIAGEQFGCLKEMLVIVSALSVQDPRERPADKQTQADQKHALFRQADSDFLFYISLWQALYGSLFANPHLNPPPKGEDVPPHSGRGLGGGQTIVGGKKTAGGQKSKDAQEELIPLAQSPYLNEQGQVEKLTNNQRKSFAKKHFLSPPRLREWQQTHSQLSQMVDGLKLKINQEPANFSHIHQALLTGLLSFIAQKVNDVDKAGNLIKAKRGEYVTARQHKAKIFPASTLFKQNPTWLMAFEVVETSQVFMRTLAKIEPEWILTTAGELLKYHYFEPHWSVKTGHVKAYAQISLFGLIVEHKKLTNYEKVNLSEAHDIFLRDALVLGNLNPPSTGDGKRGKLPPFLQHNLDKVADVSLIEDKLRRRDLLVDEEQLYQFYAKRVPEHIASRKAFEDWRKEVEKKDAQFLFFRDEDVLTETAPATQAFPETWHLGNLKLPLSYTFDPTSDDDGVTIKVPLQALPQLDAVELLWGIAGWRYELVLQLLKTLPKDIRRQIVPIPDTAKAIFASLEQNHQAGLLRQLGEALAKRGVFGANGAKIEAKDFNPADVDRYLQPQIALVDNKNRLIEKGRDIDTLKQRHQVTTSQAVASAKGVHTEFPEHFNFIQNRHSAGVLIKQFSALVTDKPTDKKAETKTDSLDKKTVAIQQFTDVKVALDTHRQGVLALMGNELGAKAKQLTSQIDKNFKLAFAPLGELDKLKALLIHATLDATFEKVVPDFDHQDFAVGIHDKELAIELNTLPLTLDEFNQAKDVVMANFLSVGQTVLAQLKAVYEQWQQVRQKLLMLDREIFEESIEDIEDQLDDLQLSDFVYRMSYQDWQQYPRYLQGLLVRLDRLEHNLDADLDAVYQLDKHMERLSVYLGKQGGNDKIMPYRWLVEEFRIQLFAQPMKTRVPVSDKRLEKLWDELNTKG
ncbi:MULTISPECIES: DUF3418 domain-containing protein [unclassified Moraxella]|uniref:DUF3418 domain-containing protein n=1 Tax=unclassified Moraxella TaxID=2685852 RepID=UPI003AF63F89